ncbi:NnrS family protein [Roseovarius faecimaris]|uniref:NnrS family protein n=1 Tax=Roseovarius faecimaris TaxID=2494550 RepID=A0A6I6IR72_9RHOB|nr:NnrS family protein [Roseovarius faecimaris]QGX98381.1 NnrS family protein [Roseovarius faecimaris]
MATTSERARQWTGPALFSFGFRPFFLFAALWAGLIMGLWLSLLNGADILPLALDPVSWHAHEFLFGYLSAVVAGFLLTAVPNWTGTLPVVGWPLAALSSLWIIGRLAMSSAGLWPPLWVALADLGFLLALALFLAREIVTGRNWKNLIVLAALLAFLSGNALFHLDAASDRFPAAGAGIRLGLGAGIFLIAVIGGRVVPSFTRNWLVKRGHEHLPAPPMQSFDKLCLLALVLALAAWVVLPESAMSGGLLAMTGALHMLRLRRWRGWATLSEPLVWVLHLAYLFVPLGALALGLAILTEAAHLAAASLHVWTIGAIGTMSLAVMTRATLGHTGAALSAGAGSVMIYLAMPAALTFRLIAPLGDDPALWHLLSGGAWMAGYLGFALLYGPRLLRRRPSAE